MSKLMRPVTVVELCPELAGEGLQLSYNQELLLTTIASYIHYECDAPVNTAGIVGCVIKVLKCLNYDEDNRELESTFDFLFKNLRKLTALHPALVYYDAFAQLAIEKKLEVRDSCLAMLGKYGE